MTDESEFMGVIRNIFGFLWRFLDGLRKFLHLLLLLFLFGLILAALNTSIPIVPNTAALVIDPQGELVEQFSGDPFERALQRAANQDRDTETRLRDVIDALEAAAEDKRIKLVVIDAGDMQAAGLSKLQDIAAALRAFKESGKKVIAIGANYDQAQYYLAAQADEIYLDPFGAVFVDGFEHYRMYFKEALDKLAVDLNIFKVGTYKSYTEVFTRSDMSPEEREASRAWLDALWSAYQSDITQARGLDAAALQTYADDAPKLLKQAGGDAAKLALSQKLVTALKSREQVSAELKAVVGEDKDTHLFRGISLRHYIAAVKSERALERDSDKQVAVIVAAGEILDGRHQPGTIGGDSMAGTVRDARYNDRIKAVVLRVDSPGGSMFASEQIYRELQALRLAGKPLVVSMSSTAASGGYYIAAAADEVWASPTTLTGSIGVFAAIPTFPRTLEKIGVRADGVGTTNLSGQLRLDRPLGKEARDILQTSVEHAYGEFLSRVAASRHKSTEEIDKVAQGRVWAGADAKAFGLVDELGNLQDAIGAAADRAKLGDEYQVSYIDPELSWQEALGMEMKGLWQRAIAAVGFDVPHAQILGKVLNPLELELKRWARFNDPHNLYSYCFCTAP